MNIYVFPIIVIVSLAISRAISYFNGFNLNPGGYFFIGILAILFSVICTLAPIARLANPVFRNTKYVVVSLICIGAWFVSYSSVVPSGVDGAASRLGQYSKQDYRQISKNIQEQSAEHGIGEETIDNFSAEYKNYISSLKKHHEIFSVSSFPIDVLPGKNSHSIDWSSGLSVYCFSRNRTRA